MMEIYALLTGAATGFYYFFVGAALLVSVLNFVDVVRNGGAENDRPLWAIAVVLSLIALKV